MTTAMTAPEPRTALTIEREYHLGNRPDEAAALQRRADAIARAEAVMNDRITAAQRRYAAADPGDEDAEAERDAAITAAQDTLVLRTAAADRRYQRESPVVAKAERDQALAAAAAQRRDGQITQRRYEKLKTQAEDRYAAAMRDTSATYLIRQTAGGPWYVITPEGEQLDGEHAGYFPATAAARAHHSHSLGSGRARAGEYVRLEVQSNRETNTALQLLDLAHADSEFPPTADGKWGTFCVDHRNLTRWQSYPVARERLRVPNEWCPGCRAKKAEIEAEVRGK